MENVLSPGAASPVPLDATSIEAIEDFDLLVQLHRPRIFRFLLASLRDRDTAENLTQDCFIKAYKARTNFRGESSLSTWLMQIAVNLMRDHIGNRRLMFWRRAERAALDPSLADCLVDRQSSPEEVALARRQLQAVWSAAVRLPEKQRTVFLLRFVEDMDLLEIAAATGMKEGTVKTHLFRALQAVRLRIEGTK